MVSVSNSRGILMQCAVTGHHPESCEPMVKSASTITCQRKRDMLEGPGFWSTRTDYQEKKIVSQLHKSVIA